MGSRPSGSLEADMVVWVEEVVAGDFEPELEGGRGDLERVRLEAFAGVERGDPGCVEERRGGLEVILGLTSCIGSTKRNYECIKRHRGKIKAPMATSRCACE